MPATDATTDRRSRRHETTRSEILDAAWAMARADGLAALSLRELANRVGLRAPSLYSYFPSKDAIYDAMFAQAATEFRDHLADQTATKEALHDVRIGLRAFVEFCTDDPTRYQLLFQRTIPGFEPSAGSYAIAVAALEDTRRHLRDIGVTDDRDVDLLTALSTGLADQQIANDPGGTRWLRLVDEAAEMFLTHLQHRSPPKKRGR